MDHYLRGQAAYEAKKMAKAVEAFEAALQVEPTHYWSMVGLGYCLGTLALSQRPKDRAAIEGVTRVWTGCILKRPDHAEAYLVRAAMYAQLGRYKEALADNSKAIALEPKKAAAWHNRGNVHTRMGQTDQAIADFSQAIALNPKLVASLNNRAISYERLGQMDKALLSLTKAIEADPQYAIIWHNRGAFYRKQGKLDKAIADYSEAIKRAPNFVATWHDRGRCYYEQHKYKQAVDNFSRAIDLDRTVASSWYNRGNAYADLGDLQQAVADCTEAIRLDPKDALGWFNRGTVYAQMHQLDKAIDDYTQAIRLDGKMIPALYHRALGYMRQSEAEKAVADFSRLLEVAPPDHPLLATVYTMRGISHVDLEHYNWARDDYEKALKLVPNDPSVHNVLAWLLATSPDLKVRDPGRAVALATKAVRLAPKVANYWNALGVAQYRVGHWKAAVAALDRSMALRPGGGDALDCFFSAMAHHRLGNKDQARKAYDRAIAWLEKNKETLARDKTQAAGMRRFRSEAEEVLELGKK